MGEQVALGTMLVISIPAFFMIISNFQDYEYDDSIKIIGYHYWVYLAPVTWILLGIAITLFTIGWLVSKVIEQIKQFNNWLNQK